MPDRVRIVLLCEDRAQETFFRGICRRLDQHPRVKIAPRGAGSAEQWVRTNYPAELRALRSHGPERVGLIVVVDGNLVGFIARKRQLEDAAQEAGLERRTAKDRVALCAPTRSVETWVVALCRDGIVTETDDYSQRVSRDEIRNAASLWSSKPDSCCLPSCLDAREELARLAR